MFLVIPAKHSYAGIPVDCLCELFVIDEAEGKKLSLYSAKINEWNDCKIPEGDEKEVGYLSYKNCKKNIQENVSEIPSYSFIQMQRIHFPNIKIDINN
ncbi:MAG: hypothetical protein KDK51_01260 [Deltaproteobacteria bacterium]|nr:hypothetical protein [Deltaproteobacteria bacterium]